MHDALTKLGKLPEDTLVYNGHEYTTGSAKFGLHIEPHNDAIKRYARMHISQLTAGFSPTRMRATVPRASRRSATRSSGTSSCASIPRRLSGYL